MREIKFRGWVPIYDQMINVDVLAISAVGWNSDGTGVSLAYQPRIKVMQYTGLKDKNGREIYEGDILDVEDEDYPFVSNWKGIVKFIDGSYLVENLEGTDGEYLFDETREVEIIGNIHKNPELLVGDSE